MSVTASYLNQLRQYVEARSHAGHDPYDGLNSRLFKATPFYKSELLRLCWIQFFKRCPINLRPLFCIPKSFNAKAGALFLLGMCRLFKESGDEQYRQKARTLWDLIKKSVIQRERGYAWGYNFPWQARAFYVPVGTPNIVTTVFVGRALMDFYETFHEEEARQYIAGIKEFVLNEMVLHQDDCRLCFAYIPGQKAEVHNANLLAAALLCRMAVVFDEPELNTFVTKAVNFSVADIREDGYWPYGTRPHHRWMDNFHTAFNLEALLEIRASLGTTEYDGVIRKVFAYYVGRFFLDDGTPKYYPHKLYPVDIHTIAVAILFFAGILEYSCHSEARRAEESGRTGILRFAQNDMLFTDEEKNTAKRLMNANAGLAVDQFWDKRGYFYYQKGRFGMNKIPYIRWSQAWMFYALAYYQTVKAQTTAPAS